MAVKSLDQIYKSLGSVYDPQTALIKRQQADIPTQIAAEEQGLQAKQTQAFGDILGGARQRGLGFAGIPLAEQAKYTSTEFLPALARLRQGGREQATSLEQAILGINERRRTFAQEIRESALSRAMEAKRLAEEKRQFNESLKLQRQQAAAAGSGGGSFTFGDFGGSGSAGPKSGSATALQRKDKGFNFVDKNGRPISAAAYAAAKGMPFRKLLETMARAGDRGAKTALGFVGNDYGYDPRKIVNSSLANLYNSLVWGTGRSASVSNSGGGGRLSPQAQRNARGQTITGQAFRLGR